MRNLALAVAVVSAVALEVLTPAVRAQALRRAMYVSIVDQNGAPVPDLGPADFIVREDKVTREVLTVAPAVDPMQIALLVDDSQASDPYIRDYRTALPEFFKTMLSDEGAKNQIALITIGERPTILTEYTSNRDELSKGVTRIFSRNGAGTYLLEGIIETSQGMMRRGAMRPVMIAIVTEGPELSDRYFQQVLEPLRSSRAAFHVMTIGRPVNDSHDRGIVLDEGPRESGGRHETVLAGTAISSRLQQIANDLLHQYKVTYARPETLIPPEQITVSATKPGLTARGTPVIEPPAQAARP